MKPRRYQPLHLVYKDLCTLLYQTGLRLQKKEPKATGLQRQVAELLSLFEYQTANEEATLFPAIHDYEPFMEAILRDDHRKRMQYVSRLQQMMSVAEAVTGNTDSIIYHPSFISRFNAFAKCSIQQMSEHQAMLNPVLWRYYSDEELKCLATSVELSQPLFCKSDTRRIANEALLGASIFS